MARVRHPNVVTVFEVGEDADVIFIAMEYVAGTTLRAAVAKQLGFGKETVRRWVIQDQVDAGTRDGVTTQESEEIKRLKTENRRLREDVAILKAATSFFVGELDPRNR